MRREGGQLQEGRVPVHEQLDPLARQQLAARVVAVDVLLAASLHGERLLRGEHGEVLERGGAVDRVLGPRGVQRSVQDRHGGLLASAVPWHPRPIL